MTARLAAGRRPCRCCRRPCPTEGSTGRGAQPRQGAGGGNQGHDRTTAAPPEACPALTGADSLPAIHVVSAGPVQHAAGWMTPTYQGRSVLWQLCRPCGNGHLTSPYSPCLCTC
eukprot:364818-Chlamydomonas_euryale.AAC.15